jgi:hypothetical protein
MVFPSKIQIAHTFTFKMHVQNKLLLQHYCFLELIFLSLFKISNMYKILKVQGIAFLLIIGLFLYNNNKNKIRQFRIFENNLYFLLYLISDPFYEKIDESTSNAAFISKLKDSEKGYNNEDIKNKLMNLIYKNKQYLFELDNKINIDTSLDNDCNLINYIESKDSKLRLYSWYSGDGGWECRYGNLLLFRDNQNNVQIFSNESNWSNCSASVPEKIWSIPKTNIYLILRTGSGPGCVFFKTLDCFLLNNNRLREHDILPNLETNNQSLNLNEDRSSYFLEYAMDDTSQLLELKENVITFDEKNNLLKLPQILFTKPDNTYSFSFIREANYISLKFDGRKFIKSF